MFVFDKSRKNTMVGRGGQGQTRALLLRNSSSPREDKTDAQRQFRAVHMQLQMNGNSQNRESLIKICLITKANLTVHDLAALGHFTFSEPQYPYL